MTASTPASTLPSIASWPPWPGLFQYHQREQNSRWCPHNGLTMLPEPNVTWSHSGRFFRQHVLPTIPDFVTTMCKATRRQGRIRGVGDPQVDELGMPARFGEPERFQPRLDVLGASGRSPTKRLSMVKRPARARGRRLSLHLVWFGSAYRSVLGCAHRGLGGEVERRQGRV